MHYLNTYRDMRCSPSLSSPSPELAADNACSSCSRCQHYEKYDRFPWSARAQECPVDAERESQEITPVLPFRGDVSEEVEVSGVSSRRAAFSRRVPSGGRGGRAGRCWSPPSGKRVQILPYEGR